MTASEVYSLQQAFRVLARHDVHCASDGRVLSGQIRRTLEAARERASTLTDQLQDGLPLQASDELWLRRWQRRNRRWLRPALRQWEKMNWAVA